MNRKKYVSRSIIWGILDKIIAIALPFITRTVLIYTMGELFLGLNGLFTSIMSVLSLSELGVCSAIVFSMYQPIAKGKDDEVCALLNFYKKCYRVIGFVVLTLGLLLMPFLGKLISGDIPANINLNYLYIINLLNTVISYELFAYKSSLLIAVQRNDIVSKISSVGQILQCTIKIFSLVILQNYYLFIATSILGTIFNNVFSAVICKRYYPQYICKGNISEKQLKQIAQKIKGMIFQKIGGVILTSLDTIVISAFLGLVALGRYQNYYFISNSVHTVLIVIMQSMISSIGNSVAIESVQKNYNDFRRFNGIYVFIVIWCTTCLVCLYQPFMELWVGKEMMFSNAIMIFCAIAFFAHNWCDMLYVYQEACGIWWETRFVPLFASLVNFLINIITVNYMGIIGILFGTIISFFLVYNLGYARVLFSTYFKGYNTVHGYIRKQLKYLAVGVMICSVTYVVCSIINIETLIVQLIVRMLLCVVIPALFVCIFKNYDKDLKSGLDLILGIVCSKFRKVDR